MSHMHRSNGIRSRGLLKEGVDRILMHTGLEEVLEFGEDLINVRSQLYFLPGTLLHSLLAKSAEFFEFNVIQLL